MPMHIVASWTYTATSSSLVVFVLSAFALLFWPKRSYVSKNSTSNLFWRTSDVTFISQSVDWKSFSVSILRKNAISSCLMFSSTACSSLFKMTRMSYKCPFFITSFFAYISTTEGKNRKNAMRRTIVIYPTKATVTVFVGVWPVGIDVGCPEGIDEGCVKGPGTNIVEKRGVRWHTSPIFWILRTVIKFVTLFWWAIWTIFLQRRPSLTTAITFCTIALPTKLTDFELVSPGEV